MKKSIPFDFLLDYLPATIKVVRAIGMYYIYFDKKIVLMFRKTNKNPQHNGIWISTQKVHHAGLKTAIPAIHDFVFDEGEVFNTAWLLLSDEHEDFETAAIQLCEMVSRKDERIGKTTPKSILM